MARALFDQEHDLFREAFRKFVQTELVPFHEDWEREQQVSRSAWKAAGARGFLCPTVPEEFGGVGVNRLFSMIIGEELALANCSGPGFPLHSDIVAPYLLNYGTQEQKERYLPLMVTGEKIGAIAMTEPGTGSDLQAIKTKAVLQDDHLMLNGTKMFITNGYMSDLVIVATQIVDPASDGQPKLSLVIVDADADGFTKEKPLNKMGQKAQDTCILNFADVRVPRENILGGEAGIGQGIAMLFGELAWERLLIGIGAVSGAEFCFNEAVSYTKERKAFGRPIANFQDVRFKLADMKTKISVGRAYVDQCMEQLLKGELTPADAAIAKMWCSDMACEVADQAVQMHGGYGYMSEYPVSKAFVDMRAHRIYGGANEIMKELVARSI